MAEDDTEVALHRKITFWFERKLGAAARAAVDVFI
jgi:hypothetical protein